MAEGTQKKVRSKKANTTKTGGESGEDVTAEVRLDPHNPIPLELDNIFAFSPGGNKFIPFFSGNDSYYGFNNFFVNILQARTQSATQNSCIISKVNYTLGNGVVIDNLTKEQKPDPRFIDFTKCCNAQGESFNAVLRQIIEAFYTFGNCPIEIVRGQAGGKKFLYVYVKNQLDCRKAWPDANNVSNAMIVSRWFRKKGVWNLTERFNVRIPFYRSGPGSKKTMWLDDKMAKGGTDGSSVTGDVPQNGFAVQRTSIWMKNDIAGYDHYGLPSWLPSKIFGMLEYDAAHNNLDNMDNNMSPGGMLQLQGSLSDKEVMRQAKIINTRYTGKGKIGRTMVIASEESIENSKYTPFNTFKDGNYIELDDRATDKIIMANEWDGALIGRGDQGTLGKGGAYLNELYQQKIKTVIKPFHRKIIDEFFKPLCEIADEWLGTDWSKYDLDIKCSNLFDDTAAMNNSAEGGTLFLKVVEMVAAGKYPLDAAIKFVARKFGVDESEAKLLLGNIEVSEAKEPKDKTEIEEDV